MTPEIRELVEESDLRAAFPVMRELRTHLDEQTYLDRLDDMRRDGYRLFALVDRGAIVATAGVRFGTNFYYGRYLWVFDLVTTVAARSRGHGKALLTAMEDLARDEGCDTIALSSGLERIDAHRFYERHMHYERASYSFKKSIR